MCSSQDKSVRISHHKSVLLLVVVAAAVVVVVVLLVLVLELGAPCSEIGLP